MKTHQPLKRRVREMHEHPFQEGLLLCGDMLGWGQKSVWDGQAATCEVVGTYHTPRNCSGPSVSAGAERCVTGLL